MKIGRRILMRRMILALFVLLTIDAFAFSGNFKFAYVVDSGRFEVAVIDTGIDALHTTVDLSDGPAGFYAPSGVVFSTLPHNPGAFAFVTQGPFIRVIAITEDAGGTTHHELQATVDVGSLVSQNTLHLEDLDSGPARWLPGGEGYQNTLYAVGFIDVPDDPIHFSSEPTTHQEPYFVVLDQEKLITAGGSDPSVVLTADTLCPQPISCRGTVVDVRVTGAVENGYAETALCTVLSPVAGHPKKDRQLLVYSIDRLNFSGHTWSVRWRFSGDDIGPFPLPTSIGIDSPPDRRGTRVVEQRAGRITNIQETDYSCDVGTISGASLYPTDVLTWGPGPKLSDAWHGGGFFYEDYAAAASLEGQGSFMAPGENRCPEDRERITAGKPVALAVTHRLDPGAKFYVAVDSPGSVAVYWREGGEASNPIDLKKGAHAEDIAMQSGYRDCYVIDDLVLEKQQDQIALSWSRGPFNENQNVAFIVYRGALIDDETSRSDQDQGLDGQVPTGPWKPLENCADENHCSDDIDDMQSYAYLADIRN